MPRSMDREERLRVIARASWRVLARDGLASLSVRNVAAEAGLAPSSLRYVLPTQQALREHAVESSVAGLQGRLAAVDRSGAGWPRELLAQLVPLDDERRLEMEVYVALGVAALTDETLRPPRERYERTLRRACRDAVDALVQETGGGAGPVDAAVDLESWARVTHALVDGLALQIVHRGPDDDPAWGGRVLDAHIDQIRTLARALSTQD
ncbi:TetR family transcriptional regulator C-terminal domain-containing protein [Nocardioides zeae]|uniref:TetR family transcriptional regulator C-terminal domain-containing protein n=1 Tax=Nocardioides imazamoxiresistens TaxID=3231893 RepID=A0ABU3Q123_9ACTN|nr:TetR family transcriptional regulator C-terminal domain-containing protein [Nocardioides zeae]MDT9595202.1 TetR family transcriptional regulator C-terminal domain-containing protein [Nocardioides zeae]